MLKQLLPTPVNSWQDELLDDLDEIDGASSIIANDQITAAIVPIAKPTTTLAAGPQGRRAPPYLQRHDWMPRDVLDYDGGGAFPEIHVPQYPLKMGLKSEKGITGHTLALEVDEEGKVKYDAILKQGMRKNAWVHSGFKDIVEKSFDPEELSMPTEDEVKETTERTKQALEKLVGNRIQAAKPVAVAVATANKPQKGPTYLRYTPNNTSQVPGAFNSGAKQRIVSLVEAQVDPLEPPKHRRKKVPGAIPSPPPPVQHSPPRKLTAQDQKDWKIPSCVSNWKNPKGYTIPLDKRMAADGSGVQETPMNNDFGQFVEALYIAERNAREEVKRRNDLQRQAEMQKRRRQEDQLRDLAAQTRARRAEIVKTSDKGEELRDEMRSQRKREREDERREAMKKSKTSRDRDRDVSEKIALGQAGKLTRTGEGLYDSRLFNQDQGMRGDMTQDDSYNIYDKPLMSGSSANAIYRPNKDRIAEYQDEDAVDPLVNSLLESSGRVGRPDKGFQGTQATSSSKRDRPVEFEREADARLDEEEEGDDPFGLEEFMTEAKGGRQDKPRAGSGYMAAAAGASDGRAPSSRSRVDFVARK